MALLENYLYSDEFLFEGEQAEKYKARKAAEAKKAAADEKAAKKRQMDRSVKMQTHFAEKHKKDIDEVMKKDGDMSKVSDKNAYKKISKAINGKYSKDAERLADRFAEKDFNTRKIPSGDFAAANKLNKRIAKEAMKESAELYEGAIDLV